MSARRAHSSSAECKGKPLPPHSTLQVFVLRYQIGNKGLREPSWSLRKLLCKCLRSGGIYTLTTKWLQLITWKLWENRGSSKESTQLWRGLQYVRLEYCREALSAVSCHPCLWCLTGIFITFWWMFGVKIIPHLCFTFLTLVHNCKKWARFLISLESWALFIKTRTGVKSKECQILNEFFEY